ncbi:MAG: DUF3276 family protein [Bacteroidales bacterium]|jgi:hypothetical protein|nr:PUR family DNA/RNA-binding protein [Bacteroidales bacterium]
MEGFENKGRDDIFSKVVRAGKRTYFFDVKSTRNEELYVTITESKRRYDQENDKFFYEKHKLFLYKEDFEKFSNSLTDIIHFIQTGEKPIDDSMEESDNELESTDDLSNY